MAGSGDQTSSPHVNRGPSESMIKGCPGTARGWPTLFRGGPPGLRPGHPQCRFVDELEWLNVLGLQPLGAFGHAELHSLSFLQAAEAARLNR